MKIRLLLSSIALVFVLGYSQVSQAVCAFGGNTLDMGNIINCPSPIQNTPLNTGTMPQTTDNGDEVNIPDGGGLNVMGGTAVDTARGPDVVDTSGSITTDTQTALRTGRGGDTVIVRGGTISSTGVPSMGVNAYAIWTERGSDSLRIEGAATIISSSMHSGIRMGRDGDLLEMFDGSVTGNTLAIEMRSGQDTVMIHGGTINGRLHTDGGDDNVLLTGGAFNNPTTSATINLGSGSDTLRIAADIDLGERINCRNDQDGMDIDTIIFNMEVPEQLIPQLEDELASADPQDGSIMINGILYEWVNCERLVGNFNGILTVITLDPVSSVSEITMEQTVTVDVVTQGFPAAGLLVKFEITEGPNAGEMSEPGTGECFPDDCVTDANGQVSWTYTSEEPGEDFIVATIDVPNLGELSSNVAEVVWIVIRNIPTLSEWGIMAMAGLLGTAGLLFMRRRKASA